MNVIQSIGFWLVAIGLLFAYTDVVDRIEKRVNSAVGGVIIVMIVFGGGLVIFGAIPLP